MCVSFKGISKWVKQSGPFFLDLLSSVQEMTPALRRFHQGPMAEFSVLLSRRWCFFCFAFFSTATLLMCCSKPVCQLVSECGLSPQSSSHATDSRAITWPQLSLCVRKWECMNSTHDAEACYRSHNKMIAVVIAAATERVNLFLCPCVTSKPMSIF